MDYWRIYDDKGECYGEYDTPYDFNMAWESVCNNMKFGWKWKLITPIRVPMPSRCEERPLVRFA